MNLTFSKRSYLIFFIAAILALMAFSVACSAPPELTQTKELLLSNKDLQKKGIIPHEVFYNQKYEKLAISFRGAKDKRMLIFYDATGGIKPTDVFETAYADEIFKPSFGENLSVAYGMRYGPSWEVFVRPFLSGDAKSTKNVLITKSLQEFVLDKDGSTVIYVGDNQGKYGIFPAPFEGANYKFIESLLFDEAGKLIFKALKHDGTWIVYSDGRESEPYSFISKLARSKDDGSIAYIARDVKEENWYAVYGEKKTKLDKIYREIGYIEAYNGKIYFSGVLKNSELWEINANNKTLASKLVYVPVFTVLQNGKIVYSDETEKGIKYVQGKKKESEPYKQIEQLLIDGYGNIFAKVKNKFGLWQIVSDGQKSAQYVWMSKMFLDKGDNVFFFGVTSSGDMEFSKFYNK